MYEGVRVGCRAAGKVEIYIEEDRFKGVWM